MNWEIDNYYGVRLSEIARLGPYTRPVTFKVGDVGYPYTAKMLAAQGAVGIAALMTEERKALTQTLGADVAAHASRLAKVKFASVKYEHTIARRLVWRLCEECGDCCGSGCYHTKSGAERDCDACEGCGLHEPQKFTSNEDGEDVQPL